ncbi:MAG: Mrp/NBP35 family ATP-binding protein [Deltaproteobacteria bacterium]|nr:Mrp/NBP35 family ATP-binding protein [Deltaproteobacteria bacterium]
MLRQLPLAGAGETGRLAAVLGRIRHKIFVMSGKGGVGKSSVSVNLATALSDMGYKTGLLDLDLHGPSVPGLLGIKDGGRAAGDSALLMPVRARENLLVLSLDILLRDRDQAVIWRGPKKNAAIRQLLAGADWGDLDFLFMDSPPGTGDEHLAVLRFIPDVLCLVVTTPHQVALADARKTISFLRATQAAALGVVENMSLLHCPHCGEKIHLSSGSGEELAAKSGLSFLGAVPFDPEASRAADAGVPAADIPGANPAKEAYSALAAAVVRLLSERV